MPDNQPKYVKVSLATKPKTQLPSLGKFCASAHGFRSNRAATFGGLNK